ncbi:MAG: helix-turn-helix transcriptional regulator [Streptosporangiaceae bacterium]|jgi:transcriptional regulator with XRE-family HTH domain
MTSDQGPVVQSALLRSELVRLRKETGLTQQQVAANLDWSQSKIIRIEGGHSSITRVDLDALLGEYGPAAEKERGRLQALNRDARKQGWWHRYREVASPEYLAYVGYESGAASIRQFQGAVVPGLLQTREYAEVLTVNSVEDEDKVGPVVDLRLQRQAELAKRENPPRQTYVLDEAVVRRHVGIHKDPAIMPAQLRHIVGRARSDERITIRVILFEAGAHAGLSGPFTLLDFDADVPELVYLDAGRGTISMIIGSEGTISEYAASFEALLEDALPADKSLEFIERAAEDMS